MPDLPDLFWDRLERIIPSEHLSSVKLSFSSPSPVSVRVNTLKADKELIVRALLARGIQLQEVAWNKDACILKNFESEVGKKLPELEDGTLYRQGLSSMLPPVVLQPLPGDRVLDLCAAPGSKTTQMAAMMKNEGTIVAVEAIRNRFYKLKSVVTQSGTGIIEFKVMDGRKFRTAELFDKILVDAPCSSEGRFKTFDKKSFLYWSPRKIKEMMHKQRGLLLAASRLLKEGGTLLYSTCSFAPEENEGVVDWFLRKSGGGIRLVSIETPGVKTYPALTEWGERTYSPEVSKCFRVLPDEAMEGFFMAKFIRD